MGLLVDGVWRDDWYDTKSTGGKYVRQESQFRNWITPDGRAGPSGKGGFRAESGRYHLYVSYACPWAHRTLIYRAVKGLTGHVTVDVVHPDMLSDGWSFADYKGETGDRLFGYEFLHQIYTRTEPGANTRVTVPVLWDKELNTIVSNESAEIIRMFNSAFDELTADAQDFYPQALRSEIDVLNARIYSDVNNGVYKAGFATTQEAYSKAVIKLLGYAVDARAY